MYVTFITTESLSSVTQTQMSTQVEMTLLLVLMTVRTLLRYVILRYVTLRYVKIIDSLMVCYLYNHRKFIKRNAISHFCAG